MSILICGGAGFVGLNIAQALMTKGEDVAIFDINPPPAAAFEVLDRLKGRLTVITNDIRDEDAVRSAVDADVTSIIFGAAITAGSKRETASPASILDVNLRSIVPILEQAASGRVKRFINLSSVAVYGQAVRSRPTLHEDDATHPGNLYATTKLASEHLVSRLGQLWNVDVCSLRLSAVFGPWEYATGQRDTLSPPYQVMRAIHAGQPVLLPRDAIRDWVYSADVAAAVLSVLSADRLSERLYNVTAAGSFSLLEWSNRVAARHGIACRLAEAGETANVDLHAGTDRLPMSPQRMQDAFGWTVAHDLARSADHLSQWWLDHPAFAEETA